MLSVDRAGLFFIYHIVLILYTPIYILFLVVSRIQTRITNTIAYLSYMAYIKLTHYVSIERVHYCILMVIKVDRVGCWSLEWICNSTILLWFRFSLNFHWYIDCKTWNKMKSTFHQIIGYQCIAEVLKRFTCPQTFLVKLYWKSNSGEAALEIWFINLSL